VPDPARVESEAVATILGYLRSLLPPRPMPPLGPECTGALGFDVELRRSLAEEGPAARRRSVLKGAGARERKGFGQGAPGRGPGSS
jgi:hypothetical protein